MERISILFCWREILTEIVCARIKGPYGLFAGSWLAMGTLHTMVDRLTHIQFYTVRFCSM